jgi:hypothetical protein
MGFFDKAKAALGLGSGAAGAQSPPPATSGSARPHKKDGRPPLRDIPKTEPGGSLEDALAAREAGRPEEARKVLATLDRGKGLRTVLRAAAALEAGDLEELGPLLAAVEASEPAWMLPLQIAAGLDSVAEAPRRASLVELAASKGAPGWALAWTRASSQDETERRQGMVDLLFRDASLARTVAARDWKIDKALEDRSAIERYASFAHGRDAVRRFGAVHVAEVLARARGTRP